MSFVKKITLSLSALFLTVGVAMASQSPELEQSATQAQASTSQIKEEQKLGYCWVNLGGTWVYVC